MSMSRDSSVSFLGGIVAGAAGTVAGLWACGLLGPLARTLHVERTIYIGRPVDEVFAALASIQRMPQLVRSIVSVATCEDLSTWIAQIEGRRYEWDVEIVQVIPQQVIGWKSHNGPKHSGRINFFSTGENTLLQIEMNYVRGLSFTWISESPSSWNIADAVNAALRDIKTTLESSDRMSAGPSIMEQATGTFGLVQVRYPPKSITD